MRIRKFAAILILLSLEFSISCGTATAESRTVPLETSGRIVSYDIRDFLNKCAEDNCYSNTDVTDSKGTVYMSVEIDNAKVRYEQALEVVERGSLGFFEAMGSTTAVEIITEQLAENRCYMDENGNIICPQFSTNSNPDAAPIYDLGKEGDSTSLENMKRAISQLYIGNEYRITDDNFSGLSALRVSDTMMAVAQAQTDASRFGIFHSILYNVGENLAWGNDQPYSGWYVDEKLVYECKQEFGYSDQQAVEYLKANGYPLLSVPGDGHYLNVVRAGYTTTGYGIASGHCSNGQDTVYGTVHGQTFSMSTGIGYNSYETSYTVEEYEKRFLEYYDRVYGELKAAEDLLNQALGESFPQLTAVYNSAFGADLRFKPYEDASGYIIMRKESGIWTEIDKVSVDELSSAGTDLKYIDTTVKANYGSGYIYSVAAYVGNTVTSFDRIGLALYRLDKPKITAVTKTNAGDVVIKWGSTASHGYELQYSNDGKIWTKTPETTETEIKLSGIADAAGCVFRLRCFKDNNDRGRTYSEYSEWARLGQNTGTKPVLKEIYNSAKGADIRWIDNGASDSFVIMRKENGVWKEVKTVSAQDLDKEGNSYKYIDTEVVSKYGKGFIYSVAVRRDDGSLLYDTVGLPLYRLKAPVVTDTYITYSEEDGSKSILFILDNMDVHGYEIQISYDSGESWVPAFQFICTWVEIYGLDPDYPYLFRIRCQKTNQDRGTTWSQYTPWLKSV